MKSFEAGFSLVNILCVKSITHPLQRENGLEANSHLVHCFVSIKTEFYCSKLKCLMEVSWLLLFMIHFPKTIMGVVRCHAAT